MKRRGFILLLGSAAAAVPRVVRAQQPAMPVIGFLRDTSLADEAYRVAAFRQGLKEGGFVEGQNVVIDYRSAEDQSRPLPALVGDLVRQRVALIFGNTRSALAAKAATTTTPIIFTTAHIHDEAPRLPVPRRRSPAAENSQPASLGRPAGCRAVAEPGEGPAAGLLG